MKKLYIAILMFISVFTFTQNVDAAFSTDTSDRYEEHFTLCDGNTGTYCDTATDGSDFLFNGVIVTSYQDLFLTEGQYDEVTFELANVFDHVVPKDGYEVSTIQMKINLGTHYESDNVVYTSNETDLRKEITTYPVGETTENYEATQFILDIDPNGYKDIVNYVADFSFTSDGSIETGWTRVSTTTIIVMYTKTLESYDNVIDVDSDYSKLPNTQETFLDIVSIEEYDASTHSYKMNYAVGDTAYSFNVSIPEDMYNYVYSSPYKERIYFKDIPAEQMSIGTSPDGENILYIQPDFSKSHKPAIMENGDEPDIVGFATINLTTMEYNIVNKLQLMGVVAKEKDRYAYLYCYFPTQIEDLLSITVSYEYRINSLLGIKGEWQETMATYVQGDQYDGQPPSWLWWIPGAGWGWASATYITGDADIYNIDNVIQPIEAADLPGEVDYRYVNELGGDEYDKYSKELYKITLGQFQDGLFTAWSDENAYDIDELVILDILYEYKGQVYQASSEEMESIIANETISPSIGQAFSTAFLDGEEMTDADMFVYGIIALVGVVLLLKMDLKKYPWMLFVVIGLGVYFLYQMGMLV